MPPTTKTPPVTLPPVPGAGSAPTNAGGAVSGTGSSATSGAYSAFSGLTAENYTLAVQAGNTAPLTGGEFNTVLGGAQWLAKASASDVMDIQEWLISSGLLSSSTKGLAWGVVTPAVQAAWDHALTQAAASDGTYSVSSYLSSASAAGGMAGFQSVDTAIEAYVNTKPSVQTITVTSTPDIQNVYTNAYRLTHGIDPSPAETAQFVNYYQQQQAQYQQAVYNAKDVANSDYESRANTLTKYLSGASQMPLADFVQSYGQTMTGALGEQFLNTQPYEQGIGAVITQPHNTGGITAGAPNARYYINPDVWEQYAHEYGVNVPESKASPAQASKVFQHLAASLYLKFHNWATVAEFMATGSTTTAEGQQISANTVGLMNTDAPGIVSSTSGGIITPQGTVANPTVPVNRQTPELQGEAAQYAEGQNVPEVDATSMASLAGEVVDRMFRPGGFEAGSTVNADTGAGMPGITGVQDQAAPYVQPTVTPAAG